jgi:hypothetical protein
MIARNSPVFAAISRFSVLAGEHFAQHVAVLAAFMCVKNPRKQAEFRISCPQDAFLPNARSAADSGRQRPVASRYAARRCGTPIFIYRTTHSWGCETMFAAIGCNLLCTITLRRYSRTPFCAFLNAKCAIYPPLPSRTPSRSARAWHRPGKDSRPPYSVKKDTPEDGALQRY